MKDLRDKVAVITGAASGIGLAMAERAATEGMRVVMADIEAERLGTESERLAASGAELLAVPCDVGDADSVCALERRAREHFGAVHLLCNNAGVSGGGKTWEIPLEEWRWILDVNMWSVIYGLHYFLPGMLSQGEPGHVVNTASIAGLMSVPDIAPYSLSKHAVVSLSEGLFSELRNEGGQIGVSVLCPSFVATQIHLAARNRALSDRYSERQRDEELEQAKVFETYLTELAMPVSKIGDLVFDAIRENHFYILTHKKGSLEHIERRMRGLRDNDPPHIAEPSAFPVEWK